MLPEAYVSPIIPIVAVIKGIVFLSCVPRPLPQVVECGRRLLLTSALVMIEPGTTTQCALACVFAFLSLVGFELIMPYTSKDDAWLYRMVRYETCLSWLIFMLSDVRSLHVLACHTHTAKVLAKVVVFVV